MLETEPEALSPQQWAQVHYLSLPILAKTNSPEGCLAYGEYVFELPPAPHHVELVETILQAIYNRQDTLILEPAGAAKCQPGSARVAMASGELRALRDVRPGEDVVGLTDDLRLVRATVRDARPTGRKPIVIITTRGGHIARVSDVHRLRAFAGWREARDLEVGDYLAAPRQLPVGTHSLDHEAKLLAYWIAEGCRTTTYSSVAISNTTPEILADARSAATAMGWGVTETKEGGRVVGLRFTGREPGGHGWNLARRWLLSHGLDTRTMGAWEKHVPTAVLESDELTTALFLSRLFGCDGSISVKHGRGRDGAVIAYTSVSRRLIEDIRHLLLRFGIISSVRQIKTRAGAYRGTAWLLSITDAYSVAHFVNRIGLFGKQAKARALIADARRDRGNALHERIPRAWHRLRPPLARRYNGARVRFDNLAQGTTRAGVATVARATGDETLRMLAESDVWWDQIVSIVSDGEEETFDLQVEDVESYVSDGLISHNTTWGNRNFLSWLISMFPDVRVGLFSETATFSESFSRSIMTAFEANSRHREMFGDLVNGGKWTVGEWIRKGSRVSETKDLTLFAGGTGGQVASKRFDVLLLDDILGKSNTDTPDQRLKVKSWFDIALRPRRAPGAVTVGLGCLVSGTPVLMADGTWRAIESIEVGERVWSTDESLGQGSGRRVEAALDQGVRQTYRVSTRTSTVVATDNHPFLVWRQGRYRNRDGSTEWVRVEDLRVGDQVVEVKESSGSLDHPWMEESFCWLLGYLFGDGWITDGRAICCAIGTDEERTGRLLATLTDWFPTVAFKKTPFGYVRADSVVVASALLELGLTGTATTKRLPDWLFRAPPGFRRSFLKGFCEADGAQQRQRMLDSWNVELSNRRLIEDLRQLALTSGVRPGRISGRTRSIQAPHSLEPASSTTYRVQLNFAYASAPEISSGRGRRVVHREHRLLDQWRLTRVVSIERAEIEQVWDLTVEGTHAFVADGLLVHNTRWSPEDLYELLALATAQGGYGFFLLLRRALIETPGAECECGDPAHGGWVSYWPSFWKLHDLMRMREQNPAAFDCAYMNDIAGLIAGDVFQTSWIQYYGTKTGDPFLELPSDRSFSTRTGVDLATSTKQRADFTAATSSAMDGNGNYFVMRSQRDRISVGHAGWISEFYTALPTGVVVVESNQHQSTVAQEMMRDYPRIPVKAHHTDSDKDQRARAVAEKYRMRKVWHHESLRDGDLEREMRAYPKGHDDLIDSLGMSMELGGSSFFYGKLSGHRPTPEQVMSRLRQPYSLTGS